MNDRKQGPTPDDLGSILIPGLAHIATFLTGTGRTATEVHRIMGVVDQLTHIPAIALGPVAAMSYREYAAHEWREVSQTFEEMSQLCAREAAELELELGPGSQPLLPLPPLMPSVDGYGVAQVPLVDEPVGSAAE